MSLSDLVLRTIRVHRMIPEGGRTLVALSGGPDSVALTLLLKELEDRGLLRLSGIAHVNHALREQADRDEAFCRAFSEELGVPFWAARIDVREVARRQRRSVEDAGRLVRYGFFERVLKEHGLNVVATGHTRNDQAETFLLRLIRGAGPRGLAGIYPVAGSVVRPLLDVRREQLLEYLIERGQTFCEDETNRDLSIPRNRIRHALIPCIEREFTPAIIEILSREAEISRRDHDRLQQEAIDSSGLIVLRTGRNERVPLSPDQVAVGRPGRPSEPVPPLPVSDIVAVEIDTTRLATISQAVGSRVVRLALSVLAPDRFVGFEHVEAVLGLATTESGGVSLPGQQARRREGRIELVRTESEGFANSFCFPLSIPGEAVLEAQGWAISAQLGSDLDCRGSTEQGNSSGSDKVTGPPPLENRDLTPGTAAVRAASLVLPLSVRSRRPGDRFSPPGMRGRRRKLQDFLVDRKVARETRDSLPLVVDAQDRIVWIVGHAVGEDFRVTEPSQGVILLKARRLGGPG